MKHPCRLLLGVSIVASLSGLAIPVHAQQSAPASLQLLTGGVYWSDGGAAVNVGVLVGKDRGNRNRREDERERREADYGSGRQRHQLARDDGDPHG